MGQQRSYSWEFKLQMVQLLEKGEQNPSQISRDQQVTRRLLYGWWQLSRERGEAAFVPTQADHASASSRSAAQCPRTDRPSRAALWRACTRTGPAAIGGGCAQKSLASAPIRTVTRAHRAGAGADAILRSRVSSVACCWSTGNGPISIVALQPISKTMSGFVPPFRKCVKPRLSLALVVSPKRWCVPGGSVNHKRVWRVMRQAGLTCRRKRRTVQTTDSRHSYHVYPNLVIRLQVEAPNRCWVADLTYRGLPEGFVYLAFLLDISSRKWIGWSLSRRMDAQLPLQALEMALAQRPITAGLLHHSYRGRQYWSNVYVERLLEVGACISLSTPGQPTEHAFAESFFKTLSVRGSLSAPVSNL